MEQIMGELIKVLISTIVAGVVLYVGIVNKLRSDIALHKDKIAAMKEKLESLEKSFAEVSKRFEELSHKMAVIENSMTRIESRQDSHSKKYDELLKLLNDLKLEMVKQFGKLTSEMTSFSSMVEASDKGVKIKKKKG